MEFKDLYQWWLVNGKPNREQLRKMDCLPYGLSSRTIEAILPKLNKEYNRLPNEIEQTRGARRVVIASDFHSPFIDKEAVLLFLTFLKDTSPNELVLNGNVNDMSSFSNYPKIREVANAIKSSKQEREAWFGLAGAFRLALPKSPIKYIGSQCHEGRMEKWVSLSPILAEDDNYKIENWLKLSDYGIDFIPEVYDPIRQLDVSPTLDNPNSLQGSKLIITHGTVCRSKSGVSAMAEMEYNGVSTITAHTHRLSQVFKTTMRGTDTAVECGCMCRREPWYYLRGKRRLLDWQQGFVVLNINEDGSYSTQLVPIMRDSEDKPFISFGGEIWK